MKPNSPISWTDEHATGQHAPAGHQFPAMVALLGRAANRMPAWFFRITSKMIADAFVAFMAVLVAYQLRFDAVIPQFFQFGMWALAFVLPIVHPLSIHLFGGYWDIWRYVSMRSTMRLVVSTLPAILTALLLRTISLDWDVPFGIPLSVIVMEAGLFVLGASIIRIIRRHTFAAAVEANERKQRVVLVGSEESLPSALVQVTSNPNLQVIGLLAPEQRIRGLRISGFTVMAGPEALGAVLASHMINLVVIADASLECVGSVVATATDFGVDVRLLPSANNVLKDEVRVAARLRPEMALLERGAVTHSPHPKLTAAYENRVVLVTGAGGSIGSEICRQAVKLPIRTLVMVDSDENSIFELNNELGTGGECKVVPLVADIRHRDYMQRIFATHRPHVVLHAAAYKHVPVMEHNRSQSVLNNVIATRDLVDIAIEFGAERFLMISTDKAVKPTSVMGATKRLAEMTVQSRAERQGRHGTLCACVRFGNVLGSRGSVVPIFLRQIAAGGPITITNEQMTRYFMTIPEAVQLVLRASTLAASGDIFMLDMGDPVKIMKLAQNLIEMSGMRPGKDIEIQIVGMRPGEKLHEQLWTEDALVSETEFPHILKVAAAAAPSGFEANVEALGKLAATGDDEAVLESLTAFPIGFTRPEPAATAAVHN